jgi:hypothetical protein
MMMVRNMENARKKDIVFQRLQTLMQFYETYADVLYTIEFRSYEEFREKYARKPEWMSNVWYVLNHFNALGLLVKRALKGPPIAHIHLSVETAQRTNRFLM